METQAMQAPKRIRTKSLPVQLQQALNAAQALDSASPDELTISRMKLTQVRLETLNRMLHRERTDKIQKLKKELTQARAEIDRLKAELAQAQAQSPKPKSLVSLQIEQALAKHQSRAGAGRSLGEQA